LAARCISTPTSSSWIVLDRGEIVAEIRPKDMTVAELTEYLIYIQYTR
jgi:hypothetical protein